MGTIKVSEFITLDGVVSRRSAARSMTLIDSETFSNGVLHLHYAP